MLTRLVRLEFKQSAVKRGAPEPTSSAKRVAWGDTASASGPAHGADVTASASGPAIDADEKVDYSMIAVLCASGVTAYSPTTSLPDVNKSGLLGTVGGLVYDVRGGPELVDEIVRAPVVKDLVRECPLLTLGSSLSVYDELRNCAVPSLERYAMTPVSM